MDTHSPVAPRLVPSQLTSRFQLLLVALGFLLVLAFAPYDIMGRNLWGDEAFTASYTTHTNLSALLEDVRKNEETPPLYFLSIWLWSRLVGNSEVALRSFSLICGAFTVVAFAGLVHTRLSRKAAMVAVVTLALAPLHRLYLAEARSYSLSVLMVTLCIWAFERLRAAPERVDRRLLYAAAAAACFLTSYITVALLMAQWMIWLIELRNLAGRRQRLIAWGQIWLLVGLAVLPWLPALFYQISIAPEVTAKGRADLLDYYVRYLSVLMGHPLEQPWEMLWLVGASGGYVLALVGLVQPQIAGGLSLRTFAPTALMTGLVLSILGLLWAKYALLLVPCLAIAMGVGFTVLHERRSQLAIALVALVIGTMTVSNLMRYPYPAHSGWSQATQVIAQTAAEGDIVVMGWPADQRVFEYYYQGLALPIVGARNFDDFYVGTGHSYVDGWRLDEVLRATAGAQRIWVAEETYYSNFAPVLPYPLQQSWDFGWIKLRLYKVTRPAL